MFGPTCLDPQSAPYYHGAANALKTLALGLLTRLVLGQGTTIAPCTAAAAQITPVTARSAMDWQIELPAFASWLGCIDQRQVRLAHGGQCSLAVFLGLSAAMLIQGALALATRSGRARAFVAAGAAAAAHACATPLQHASRVSAVCDHVCITSVHDVAHA